ncbi:MAG: GDSL-type esterase/lipase family protein [Terriglobales bacterium]
MKSVFVLSLGGLAIFVCAAVAQDSALPKWIQEFQTESAPKLMRDYAQLAEYRDADSALKPPASGEQRVVFIGDSITNNWDLAKYFPGRPYVNRGIGWQNTAQMLLRFRQDVINLHPRVVVILGGTNDISGAYGVMSPEDIESNYQSMAQLARSNGIEVIFASVLPVHNYTPVSLDVYATHPPEKILALNRWLQEYSKANGYLYLDYWPALVDEKGLMRKDFSEDGCHPNVAGYHVMAPLAEAAIAKALARPQKRVAKKGLTSGAFRRKKTAL